MSDSRVSDDSGWRFVSGDDETSDDGEESVSETSDSDYLSFSPSPQLPKRPKASEPSDSIDRISSLPEAVIVHILSFLPIRYKIRTGGLSRAWRYLWTRVPNLYFSSDDYHDDDGPVYFPDFVQFVNKTLAFCDGVRSKSLGVRCEHDPVYTSAYDSWTDFALRNGTENFELDFSMFGHREAFYELPQSLFTNSSFKELRLLFCIVEPRQPVAWKFLKKLTIRSSKLSDAAIQRIIEATPMLEVLELGLFKGDYCLDFGILSAKKLILDIEEMDPPDKLFDGVSRLKISVPNVECLEISGYVVECKLEDVSSVVEASLYDLPCLRGTQTILESLVHVQTLTLRERGSQRLSMGEGKLWDLGSLLQFPKCKCLTIHMVELSESNLSAMANFLKSFPEMETLIVSTFRFFSKTSLRQSYNSNNHQDWISGGICFNFLTYLRKVEFYDLAVEAFPFVQFLLKNARLLQKMTVDLELKCDQPRVDPKEVIEVYQKLLSFPRSSPDAELLVY